MDFLFDNWFLIVAAIAVVCAVGYFAVKFFKMPSTEQLVKVRQWLLYAVIEAEKALGGGTGKLKLRYVYDMFVGKFVWLAKVISFEQFSILVDDALEEMRALLDTNDAIAEHVASE